MSWAHSAVGAAILLLSCIERKAEVAGFAETAGPHIATLCVPRERWSAITERMKQFGARHKLELHGTVQETEFNFYLARNFSISGDDLDIWVTSDPFRTDRLDLNAIPKRKPMTRDQFNLANGLLLNIRNLSYRTLVGEPSTDASAIECR